MSAFCFAIGHLVLSLFNHVFLFHKALRPNRSTRGGTERKSYPTRYVRGPGRMKKRKLSLPVIKPKVDDRFLQRWYNQCSL